MKVEMCLLKDTGMQLWRPLSPNGPQFPLLSKVRAGLEDDLKTPPSSTSQPLFPWAW